MSLLPQESIQLISDTPVQSHTSSTAKMIGVWSLEPSSIPLPFDHTVTNAETGHNRTTRSLNMSKFFALLGKAKIAAASALVNGGRNIDKNGKPSLPPWVPGTAAFKTSTVEISISCRNLADRDVWSKSDPMVVVYSRPPGSKSWVQLVRTEVVQDDLNPDFATKAIIPFYFEQVQKLRFEVYDMDSRETDLSKQDKLGFVETSLGQIVTSGSTGLTLELLGLKNTIIPPIAGVSEEPQTIILTAEELACEKDEVTLRICGNNCGTWSGIIPPKTFFSISKINDAGRYIVVYRSKPSRGTNPNWAIVKMSSRTLCNGDQDRELKIEVWQSKISGRLISLGFFRTSLTQLLKTSNQERFELRLANGEPTRSVLRVLSCQLQPINTFVEYLQGGTKIQCCFAIDFTCSNGDPEDTVSLHYISKSPNCLNPYEQAIQSVGNILRDYDSTNLFPAYGFGARIPPAGEISYNFPLNLTKNPNCQSIFGVQEAYRSCVKKIMLYGPTNFAPIINTVAEMASKSKGGSLYYILVIITDGVISDLQKTKKAIVEASAYPLSIVIIGVGEADFDSMEELDGDAVRLEYRGKKAKRDIVQFVAYRSSRSWMANTGEITVENLVSADSVDDLHEEDQFSDVDRGAEVRPSSPTRVDIDFYMNKQEQQNRLAQSQLAAEVLAEVPDQIVSYMKSKGITPASVQKGDEDGEKPAQLPPGSFFV